MSTESEFVIYSDICQGTGSLNKLVFRLVHKTRSGRKVGILAERKFSLIKLSLLKSMNYLIF